MRVKNKTVSNGAYDRPRTHTISIYFLLIPLNELWSIWQLAKKAHERSSRSYQPYKIFLTNVKKITAIPSNSPKFLLLLHNSTISLRLITNCKTTKVFPVVNIKVITIPMRTHTELCVSEDLKYSCDCDEMPRKELRKTYLQFPI